MRPGCDRDAVARLTYDPVGCQVWLDDPTDRAGRNQEICSLHAERLTVPRGWVLSDRRSDEPAMFVAPVVAEPAPPSRRRRRAAGKEHPASQTLELFEVLRQELAEAEAGAVPVEPVPVEPEPVAAPAPAATHDPEPDELPEALQATSPLLARAFGATGHQRSVLTQRPAGGPAAEAPDEE